jgi:hypothetical protein
LILLPSPGNCFALPDGEVKPRISRDGAAQKERAAIGEMRG